MNRRRLLLLMLGTALSAAAPVAAQEAPPAAAGASPRPPSPRPNRPPRRARKPQPAPAADPNPPPAASQAPHLDAAPVPNRDLEAPRVVERDRTRLSPSVIHRRLPRQGMAAEGAPNEREERLFFPAPGARLSVPFAY
jgi:hypothetical protein